MKHHAIFSAFFALADDFLWDTGAVIPVRNPDYRPPRNHQAQPMTTTSPPP